MALYSRDLETVVRVLRVIDPILYTEIVGEICQGAADDEIRNLLNHVLPKSLQISDSRLSGKLVACFLSDYQFYGLPEGDSD